MLAVDMSSWSGEFTTREAREMKAHGVGLIIVNTWGPYCRQQLDSGLKAGLRLQAYTYHYLSIPAANRLSPALRMISGFPVERLWHDYEDDENQMSVAGVIDHIRGAVAFLDGIIPDGIYSRREWWMRRTSGCREFIHKPSWVADYDWDPSLLTASQLVDGWPVTLKQYSNTTNFCGQSVCMDWEVDVMAPTNEQLEQMVAKLRKDFETGMGWISAGIAIEKAKISQFLKLVDDAIKGYKP